MKGINRLGRILAVAVMILSLVMPAAAAPADFGPLGGILEQVIAQFNGTGEPALEGESELVNDPATTEAPAAPNTAESENSVETGVYTVTANIYIDGGDNTILRGTTAYLTNPQMPPLQPVSDNARLEINEDGSMILTVSDLNDIVSLRQIDGSDDVIILERIMEGTGENEHINGLKMKLLNDSGTYTFTNCVEKPVIIGSEQHMPLKMTVDLDHKTKGHSGFTDSGDTSEGISEEPASDEPEETKEPEHDTEIGATADGKLQAGTYTVSANIWFSKESTGLPMNPHITSSAFPPNNPVSNNATLRVDESGRGTLTVPITIQPRVLSVKSISGLPMISSQSSGGRLTSITLDMGILSADQNAVTRSCSATVELGDLAQQMSGLGRDHTWPATFQMNFKGLPNSGGGNLTEEQQKALDEANADAADEEEPAEGGGVVTGQGTLDKPAGERDPRTGRIASGAGAAALLLAAAAAWSRRKRKHR